MLRCGASVHQISCILDATIKAVAVQAASYLGHKKVEQVVTKWLQCVALSMLARDDAAISEAPEDVKEAVGMLRKSEQEWQQVLPHFLPKCLVFLHPSLNSANET